MKRHLEEQRMRKPVRGGGGRREPEDTVRAIVFVASCLVVGLYVLAVVLAGVVWLVGSASAGGGGRA